MDTNRPLAGADFAAQLPSPALDPSLRERRLEPRTTLTGVVCFSMGRDKGGVVTDVSSSGMGLCADLPMEIAGDVSFSLMVNGASLRGSGEVIWVGRAGKSYGLRFTSLTPALRFQINRWIAYPEPDLPSEPEPRFDAAPGPTVAETEQTSAAEPGTTSGPVRETFLIDDWAEQEQKTSSVRTRAYVQGLATGLVLAAAVAAVVFYLGLITWGNMLAHGRVLTASSPVSPLSSPSPSSNSASSSSASPASSGAASVDAPSLPAPTTPVSPAPSSANAAAPAAPAPNSSAVAQNPSAAQNAPANLPPADANQVDSPRVPAAATDESALDEADAYLRRGRSREATALLWSAVSAGNTAAETKLADLYLRGDGVAKSCTQGRVLLTAAAKKGNADAQERLSSLLRTGCR